MNSDGRVRRILAVVLIAEDTDSRNIQLIRVLNGAGEMEFGYDGQSSAEPSIWILVQPKATADVEVQQILFIRQ